MLKRMGPGVLPLALVLPVGRAQAQGQLAPPARVASPFTPLSAATGIEWLRFDGSARELLAPFARERRAFVLEGLRLPGARAVDLELRAVDVLAPGATARVVGPRGTARVGTSVALFAGTPLDADGYARGHAFLGVSPDFVHGYVQLEGELFFLSSGARRDGRASVARADAFPPLADDPFCRIARGAAARPGERDSALPAGSGPRVRIADVFIEGDDRFRGLFASDQEAIDYATLLVGASGELYRRDLGVVLRIPDGYLRIWNVVPPWGPITGFGDVANVQAYWTSGHPLRDLPRAAVHVLTYPVFGGEAFAIGGLCDNSLAYEVSSVFGSFPYPIEHTHFGNWDLFVVSHEFGHTFGGVHTDVMVPPIDCMDDSGPDVGTIMSLCHLTWGLLHTGMRFHARVQEETILPYIEPLACFEEVAIELGDYDYDADRDGDDLAALDQHLAQGFESAGCLETFDLDADGALTSCDRAILAGLVLGPGVPFCAPAAACPCGNDGGPCAGCANSTDLGTSLLGAGSASVLADDLVLTATQAPPDQWGLFFMGPNQIDLPFGDGRRCAGGQLFRYALQHSGPAGSFTLGPGVVADALTRFPPGGQITPGETWNFQVWHRDPAGPCGNAHTASNAFSVTFLP